MESRFPALSPLLIVFVLGSLPASRVTKSFSCVFFWKIYFSFRIKSLMYLNFIFVYGIRERAKFIFHVYFVVPTPLLRRLPLPIELLWCLCQVNWGICVGVGQFLGCSTFCSWCVGMLYISWMQVLDQVHVLWIFSPSLCITCSLLCFDEQKRQLW